MQEAVAEAKAVSKEEVMKASSIRIPSWWMIVEEGIELPRLDETETLHEEVEPRRIEVEKHTSRVLRKVEAASIKRPDKLWD